MLVEFRYHFDRVDFGSAFLLNLVDMCKASLSEGSAHLVSFVVELFLRVVLLLVNGRVFLGLVAGRHLPLKIGMSE